MTGKTQARKGTTVAADAGTDGLTTTDRILADDLLDRVDTGLYHDLRETAGWAVDCDGYIVYDDGRYPATIEAFLGDTRDVIADRIHEWDRCRIGDLVDLIRVHDAITAEIGDGQGVDMTSLPTAFEDRVAAVSFYPVYACDEQGRALTGDGVESLEEIEAWMRDNTPDAPTGAVRPVLDPAVCAVVRVEEADAILADGSRVRIPLDLRDEVTVGVLAAEFPNPPEYGIVYYWPAEGRAAVFTGGDSVWRDADDERVIADPWSVPDEVDVPYRLLLRYGHPAGFENRIVYRDRVYADRDSPDDEWIDEAEATRRLDAALKGN